MRFARTTIRRHDTAPIHILKFLITIKADNSELKSGAVRRKALIEGDVTPRSELENACWAGAYEDIHNYIGGHLPWPLQEAEQPGPEDGHSDRASQGDQPHQPTL